MRIMKITIKQFEHASINQDKITYNQLNNGILTLFLISFLTFFFGLKPYEYRYMYFLVKGPQI